MWYRLRQCIHEIFKTVHKKENDCRSFFIPTLFFMLYSLQIISAAQKLFADTKLTKNILQQIIIRNLSRNLT